MTTLIQELIENIVAISTEHAILFLQLQKLNENNYEQLLKIEDAIQTIQHLADDSHELIQEIKQKHIDNNTPSLNDMRNTFKKIIKSLS